MAKISRRRALTLAGAGAAGIAGAGAALHFTADANAGATPDPVTGAVAFTGAHQAQPGVELVDVAVRGDTRLGLGDALPTKQSGFPAVAGPGVDFHSPIIGLKAQGSGLRQDLQEHVPRFCLSLEP